ncbi:MAG TPA: EAL domain-containing protein [Stellaceae bacterium]|nr:EAL domain-containing protein [Stellaceae bacterium]
MPAAADAAAQAPPPRPIAPTMPTEDMLLAYVEQLADERAGHRALCFHLSRLDRTHRRDKHLKIATNMLRETVDQFSGRLFMLRSGDIVVVCKGITARAIDRAIEALRYLFNDDKLARENAEARFYSAFDLDIGYAQFLSLVRGIRDREAKQLVKAAQRPPAKPIEQRLSALLEALSATDLSHMVRRQTVWALQPHRKPTAKFDELFISIDRLNAAFSPDLNLAKDRQLFQYLTRQLDKHMLTRLAWEQFGNTRPVSLNINLSTLQSPEFLKFDNERASGWRGRTILEIQPGDLLADLPAWLAIADLVQQRGYLRCLDGVSFQAFPCLNFPPLKVDLVKLIWDDAMLRLDETQTRALYQAIRECGAERIVLARCGRPEAVTFGRALGVQLFQGWHLDRLQSVQLRG